VTAPEALGYVAALLTSFSFVPQAVRTWRSRATRDISLPMYLMFTTGVFLWLIYGVWTRAWPVVAANTLTFVLAAFILGLKLRER
jgi:MtN3 and saliva related transmembrane protein